MRNFLRFIATGSILATVEEFQTVFVIRGDFASYLFTLLILFPVFLTCVWLARHLLDRLVPGEAARELALFLFLGSSVS